MQSAHPAASANVLAVAGILREEAEVLDELVDGILRGREAIELVRLRELAPALRRLVVQRLADVTGLPVAVSPEREATTRGAGLMALVAHGALSVEDVEGLWTPSVVVTPSLSDDERLKARHDWSTVVARVEGTIPELSAVEF